MAELKKLLRALARKSMREEVGKRSGWFKTAAQISGAAWVSTIVAFLATVVAARGLGPTDFGEVVLAVAVTGAIATFLDISLEEAVVHHGAKAVEAKDIGGLRAIVRNSIKVDLGAGLVVSGLMIAFAGPLADLASKGHLPSILIQIGALQALVTTLDATTGASLLVAGRPALRGWAMATQATLRLVGVLIALQLGGEEAVMIAYLVAALVASAIQATITWRVAWRPWAAQSSLGTSPVPVRKLFRFGMHTSFATSVSALHQYLFPVILGRLASIEAVGIFKIAMLPVTLADTVSGPIRIVVLPQQARLAAQNRWNQLRRAMSIYTGVGLAISAVGFVVGWFLLPTLIPAIYSSAFGGAVEPARILMVAA
ncbi:MAG TPA: oligosaccharide flippase family protein, partial [Gaiellales bacterium]|nr:oligosaccharide flippase family protein [Gaiellales bacterium]